MSQHVEEFAKSEATGAEVILIDQSRHLSS
jgi:hypothetical protein